MQILRCLGGHFDLFNVETCGIVCGGLKFGFG